MAYAGSHSRSEEVAAAVEPRGLCLSGGFLRAGFSVQRCRAGWGSLGSCSGSSVFLAVPVCPSFPSVGNPTQFSVFPELMLGSGRNECDVADYVPPFSPKSQAAKGRCAQGPNGREVSSTEADGETPSGCPHGL